MRLHDAMGHRVDDVPFDPDCERIAAVAGAYVEVDELPTYARVRDRHICQRVFAQAFEECDGALLLLVILYVLRDPAYHRGTHRARASCRARYPAFQAETRTDARMPHNASTQSAQMRIWG